MANYSLDNFIKTPVAGDKKLEIYNSSGVLMYMLEPLDVNFFYRNNKLVIHQMRTRIERETCRDHSYAELDFDTQDIESQAVVIANNAKNLILTYSEFIPLAGSSNIQGDLIPAEDGVISLGSEEFRWKELHVSGGNIYMDGIPLTTDGGSLMWNNERVVYDYLSELLDVNISGVTENQILIYSGGTWVSDDNTDLSDYYTSEEVDNLISDNDDKIREEACFTSLNDTPTSYEGYTGYTLTVNSGGTGIEFTENTGGGITETGVTYKYEYDIMPDGLVLEIFGYDGDRFFKVLGDYASYGEINTSFYVINSTNNDGWYSNVSDAVYVQETPDYTKFRIGNILNTTVVDGYIVIPNYQVVFDDNKRYIQIKGDVSDVFSVGDFMRIVHNVYQDYQAGKKGLGKITNVVYNGSSLTTITINFN